MCKDIAELTRENLAERAKERRYLLEVVRGLRYRGEDNHSKLFVLLGAKDKKTRDYFNIPLGNKSTSHVIRNE